MFKKLLLLPLLAILIYSGCKKDEPQALQDKTLTKIAFGSCGHQFFDLFMYSKVLEANPDLYIGGGDNIYGDYVALAPGSSEYIKQQWERLANNKNFINLRANVPIIATWDDHDYGMNDGGGEENPVRVEARRLFCNFFGVPGTSERRSRPDGIYTSYYYGDDAHKVQIILLDLRWNRSPYASGNAVSGYEISTEPGKTFLGDAQWTWLRDELSKPAKVRIIMSSLQFSADYNGGENWALFPNEKDKFISLIKDTRAEGIVFLSGDVHFGDLNRITPTDCYPLYDLTSSGINMTTPDVYASANRIAETYSKPNYGMINIDWESSPVKLTLQVRGSNNEARIEKEVTLDELKF